MKRESTRCIAQSEEVGGVRAVPTKILLPNQVEGGLSLGKGGYQGEWKQGLGRKREKDMITGWG